MVVATRRVDVEKAVAKRSTTADVHARKAMFTRNLRPDREFGQDGIMTTDMAASIFKLPALTITAPSTAVKVQANDIGVAKAKKYNIRLVGTIV